MQSILKNRFFLLVHLHYHYYYYHHHHYSYIKTWIDLFYFRPRLCATSAPSMFPVDIDSHTLKGGLKRVLLLSETVTVTMVGDKVKQ